MGFGRSSWCNLAIRASHATRTHSRKSIYVYGQKLGIAIDKYYLYLRLLSKAYLLPITKAAKT